jgi:hypothetical protein
MKAITFLLIGFALLLGNYSYSGCNGPKVSTSNGIKFDGTPPSYWGASTTTVYVNETDSFFLNIVGNWGCGRAVKGVSVMLNGNIVYASEPGLNTYNFSLKLRSWAGKYFVSCSTLDGAYPFFNFEFIIPHYIQPHFSDTLEDTNSTTIPTEKKVNQEFLMFPNPAQYHVTLFNESDEIKNLKIYDLTGKLIHSIEINNTKADLPLENYPKGLYLVNVATLSDKIIIKKLIIQ